MADARFKQSFTPTLSPPSSDRPGGYVRVLRCGFRSGDRAPMAILEYVDRPGEVRLSRPPPGTSAVAAAERMQAYLPPVEFRAAKLAEAGSGPRRELK